MSGYNAKHQEFLDKASANASQAGFDFQFYVFLYLILNMEKGTSLEYETDDDILYIDSDGIKCLIQAKNSIQNTTGSYPNLTNRDSDIWHTIDNWLTQSILSQDNRFFDDRKFEIWTNKNFNNNTLLDKISKYKNLEVEITEIDDYLKSLRENTKDVNILESMNKLSSLTEVNRKKFYSKLKIIQFEGYSIIEGIKDILKYKKNIEESKIDVVYSSLFSEFKDSNFIDSCKRNRIKITADQMLNKTKRSFNRSFDRALSIDRSIDVIMPDNVCDHIFVKQLIDIEHMAESEIGMLRDIYTLKFGATNAISEYRDGGDVDSSDLKAIEASAMRIWKIAYDKSSRSIRGKLSKGDQNIAESEYIEAGLECYDIVSNKEIKFETVHLDPEFTLGYFYVMSDEPRIGWRYDWEFKYKK